MSVVIVGAGPAGIRAAQTLLAHGVKPCLVDEAPRGGGQIYRRQPENFRRSAQQLYGFEASKAESIHRTVDELATQIDYRPETLVWNAENARLDTLSNGRCGVVAPPTAFSRYRAGPYRGCTASVLRKSR